MDWLTRSLFVVVFFGGLVALCCGRNNSNFERVQLYERCVLNQFSRSHFFTEEDRVRMIKITNEANHRMQLLHMDPTNVSNVRSMLRLFAAALANLVADNDLSEILHRKDAFITVIEICSMSLPRPIAEELIHEVKRIFASVKNAEDAGSGGNEIPVLSRRKETSSRPVVPEDHEPKQRSKRSPQAAAAFSTFGGWQPTESLQTVLSNILLNSNAFLNVFKVGMSQRDALYYARSMVEAGLRNYHFSVIQDVENSVSNALSTFPFRPESADYAIAIASSITSVLDARQLSFFADGVGIGNGLVSKLQSMLGNKTPSVSFPIASAGSSSRNSQQRTMSSSQRNPGFEESKQSSAAFTSSQREWEQFQSNLAFFLYQSNKIQRAFCDGPFQRIFEMVNEGLSDFGLAISVTAAGIVNDSLTSMGSDLACAQFGNVISEEVTNVLRENNLLQSANAQLIAERMASNVSPRQPFPTQNQKDFSSQTFSNSRQEPPSFTEFSYPETQPSALNPAFQFEPPQYPSSGMLPVNPMDKTNFKDDSGTQGFPFETSDGAQIPVQQTKISEEYQLFNPSYKHADYSDDASGTMSDTDQQGANSDSRTDDSGDQRFEPSGGVSSINNPSSNFSTNPDYRMSMEAGTEISVDTFENSQSKANPEFKNNGATTRNITMNSEDRDLPISTTVNFITTTTPFPYTTTLDASKVAEILLDDIYASLRTLNSSSSSDDDKKTRTSSDTSTIETKDSSVALESTSQNVPAVDKIEPDGTKFTTITSIAEDSPTKQDQAVDLEPSFRPTSSPNLNEGSSVGDFKNGTQSSDDLPEDELELRDPTLVFAEHVASVASSSIALIRSGNVNLEELCDQVNNLAPIVDIPPLDVCNTIALVDYLLNVLKAVTFILRSV